MKLVSCISIFVPFLGEELILVTFYLLFNLLGLGVYQLVELLNPALNDIQTLIHYLDNFLHKFSRGKILFSINFLPYLLLTFLLLLRFFFSKLFRRWSCIKVQLCDLELLLLAQIFHFLFLVGNLFALLVYNLYCLQLRSYVSAKDKHFIFASDCHIRTRVSIHVGVFVIVSPDKSI
jgi:hypothetical protein